MDQIRGMVLPLPTVFDHAGQIDKPVMRQMIDYYVASGINAIFIGGSMGQGMALTQEERKALFELSVEAVNGRVPVLAHVGTADPYTTIDLGKHALKVGANALAIVRGATFSPPRILPSVAKSSFLSGPSPLCIPSESAALWMLQKSVSPAAEAKVAVLIDWYTPSRTVIRRYHVDSSFWRSREPATELS